MFVLIWIHFFSSDKESALSSSMLEETDEDMMEFYEETWTEEFCPVAEQLLQRIVTHQSDLVPLEND